MCFKITLQVGNLHHIDLFLLSILGRRKGQLLGLRKVLADQIGHFLGQTLCFTLLMRLRGL